MVDTGQHAKHVAGQRRPRKRRCGNARACPDFVLIEKAGKLAAFRHPGFWHPMDTLRDKNHLDDLWRDGAAPWKVWP